MKKDSYFETFLYDPLYANVLKLEASAEIYHMCLQYFFTNGMPTDDNLLQDISCILEFTTQDIINTVKEQAAEAEEKQKRANEALDTLSKEHVKVLRELAALKERMS